MLGQIVERNLAIVLHSSPYARRVLKMATAIRSRRTKDMGEILVVIAFPLMESSPKCSFPRLLDLRPGVAERHGAVEHRLAGRSVRIDGEIAQALELEAIAGLGRSEARLEAAAGQHLQRLGIQVHLVIDAFRHVAGIGHGEEVLIEPHLGPHGMRGRDPVDRALHLAAVGGVAAAGGRIVGAVQLDDLARLRVLDGAWCR